MARKRYRPEEFVVEQRHRLYNTVRPHMSPLGYCAIGSGVALPDNSGARLEYVTRLAFPAQRLQWALEWVNSR